MQVVLAIVAFRRRLDNGVLYGIVRVRSALCRTQVVLDRCIEGFDVALERADLVLCLLDVGLTLVDGGLLVGPLRLCLLDLFLLLSLAFLQVFVVLNIALNVIPMIF